MSYTNATFYLDYALPGSDAVRTTISAVVFSNPSGTVVRGTMAAHGLVTGAVVTVSGCTQAYANSAWKVTYVSSSTFDLDTADWTLFTGADVTGDCVPFGGASWADAWATITAGPTAARIAPGDTIRIAKSPAPASVGLATWTDGPLASTQTITSSTNATPIVMGKTAHGYVNGDLIQITGHTTNTAANGTWKVANKTADTLELVDSLGANSVGNGVGGATGTMRKVSNKVVYLDAAPTLIDACETNWTPTTGIISSFNTTPTVGGTGYSAVPPNMLTVTTGGTGGQTAVQSIQAGPNSVLTVSTFPSTRGKGYTTGTGKATSVSPPGGSGCTLNITAVADITSALDAADFKVGANSLQVTLPAVSMDSTALLAYRAVTPGTLAAYQSITFWIKNSATISANQWRICLCSDAAGATVVDRFDLPAISTTGVWKKITITKYGGGNLGASTASIALYSGTTTPTASSNIRLDQIMAGSAIERPPATVDRCEVNWTAVTGLVTVLNATPTAGGAGYTVGDILTITEGTASAQATATTVAAGVVTAVTLLKGGNGGYTTGAAKATTGGTGAGCTLNITTVGNVTASLLPASTTAKSGENCLQLATPATLQAGSKLAYRAISPGTLAAYQKLSFWRYGTVITAGQFRICLCSDAIGETVVDEFLMPAHPGLARFAPFTLARTSGGNLGASIASISIYSDTVTPTTGATMVVDNFIACTTSGLNLQSLISKNALETGGTEGWYGIQSIVDRFVMLDSETNCTSVSANGRGYSGTTENVATYIRETIKTAMAAASSTSVQAIQDSGTAGSLITFAGGWDTGTSLQTGETFFDGLNGNGYGLQLPSRSFIACSGLSFTRYSNAVRSDGAAPANNNLSFGTIANSTSTGLACFSSCDNSVIAAIAVINGGGVGFQVAANGRSVVGSANNNGSSGISVIINRSRTEITHVNNNATVGISFGSVFDNEIVGGEVKDNVSAQVSHTTTSKNTLRDCTLVGTETTASTAYSNSRLRSQNHDLGGYDWEWTDGGTINSEATDRAGGTAKMWRLLTSSTTRDSAYPLAWEISPIALRGGQTNTVKVWLKKAHATNVRGKLVCRGGQVAGIAADVVATLTDVTTWQELTLTLSPTNDCVVMIEAWAEYVAGHAAVYVDDISEVSAV